MGKKKKSFINRADIDLLSIAYIIELTDRNKNRIHVNAGYSPEARNSAQWNGGDISNYLSSVDGRILTTALARILGIIQTSEEVCDFNYTEPQFDILKDKAKENGFNISTYQDSNRRHPQFHVYLTIKCDINNIEEKLKLLQ